MMCQTDARLSLPSLHQCIKRLTGKYSSEIFPSGVSRDKDREIKRCCWTLIHQMGSDSKHYNDWV